jgi:D-lyxose ketol-isomerase
MLARAGLAITPAELARIEVADFGLADLERTGLQLLTYVNTDRYCAKELMLFPGTDLVPSIAIRPSAASLARWRRSAAAGARCISSSRGFRRRPTPRVRQRGVEAYYTVFHELLLLPGDQYTIPPDTLHWFQAGAEGALVSEFSSTSRDELDVFTDPRIVRIPIVG